MESGNPEPEVVCAEVDKKTSVYTKKKRAKKENPTQKKTVCIYNKIRFESQEHKIQRLGVKAGKPRMFLCLYLFHKLEFFIC